MPSLGNPLCSCGPTHPRARGHSCSGSKSSRTPAYTSLAFGMSTHGFFSSSALILFLCLKNLLFILAEEKVNLLNINFRAPSHCTATSTEVFPLSLLKSWLLVVCCFFFSFLCSWAQDWTEQSIPGAGRWAVPCLHAATAGGSPHWDSPVCTRLTRWCSVFPWPSKAVRLPRQLVAHSSSPGKVSPLCGCTHGSTKMRWEERSWCKCKAPTAVLVSYGYNSTTPEACFGTNESLSARMPMLNAFNLQPAILLWYLSENGLSWDLCTPSVQGQLCWWHFGAFTYDPSQIKGKEENMK